MTTHHRNRTETGQGDVLTAGERPRTPLPPSGRVTARSGVAASGKIEQVLLVGLPFLRVHETLIALSDVSAIEPINTSDARWNALVEAVSREFGVPSSAVLGATRIAYAASARFALVYVANRLGCSSPQQSAARTGRTRSMVYHAIAKCQADMGVDENYAAKVHRVMDVAQ